MLPVVALLVAFSQAHDKPVKSKQLPPTTRPYVTPAGLNNAYIVSVSETKTAGSRYPTRIFRYTFHGQFAGTVMGFMRSLTAKEGWQKEWSDTRELDFWRDLPKGPVAKQGLILAGTRLVRDYKSPFGWSPTLPVLGRGWIWISYDETLRVPFKHAGK